MSKKNELKNMKPISDEFREEALGALLGEQEKPKRRSYNSNPVNFNKTDIQSAIFQILEDNGYDKSDPEISMIVSNFITGLYRKSS